jgi:hypothetical protein
MQTYTRFFVYLEVISRLSLEIFITVKITFGDNCTERNTLILFLMHYFRVSVCLSFLNYSNMCPNICIFLQMYDSLDFEEGWDFRFYVHLDSIDGLYRSVLLRQKCLPFVSLLVC